METLTGENEVFLTKQKTDGELANKFEYGETIYCHFKVDPRSREKTVNFQWINPLGEKEQVYVHLIDKTKKDPYFVVSWLCLDLPMFADLVGSKYLGDWRVIILLNNKQVAKAEFTVY